MNKIRVLHIMNGAATGGISKVVLGICQSLIEENYIFDVAIDNPEIGFSGFKLKELGCNLIIIPKRRQIIKYIKTIKALVKDNKYDYVHIHLNESSTIPLVVTKIFGCKKVFIHMHTARKPEGNRDIINFFLLRVFSDLLADKLIACSTEAAKAMYGERLCKKRKYYICKNYIETNKYVFKEEKRRIIREELGCNSETLIIGCVGTIREEKNTIFSVKVFQKIKEYTTNSKLVFVGDGDRKNELVEYITKCKLQDNVILAGNRDNVSDYLAGFDCFLMPSLYEGFGLAALEAIASGLPVVLSNAITQDLNVFDGICYLSLDEKPIEWANRITSMTSKYKNRNRRLAAAIVKEKGFDYSSSKLDYGQMYL